MKTPRNPQLKLLLLAGLATALLAAAVGPAKADLPPGATITATIPVDDATGTIDVGFGSVWLANGGTGTVSRIDPATNQVVASIPVGTGIFGLRAGDGGVWVTNQGRTSGLVFRIDPTTNSVVATIHVGLFPIGLAVTRGAVWVANHWGTPSGSVSRIDPSTNTVVATIPLGSSFFSGPKFIGVGAGSIWVDVPNLEAVVRIDPAANAVQATIPDKGPCGGIAASDTAVWVAGGTGPSCSPGITRIDPATNTLVGDKINAGGNVADVALGLGSLWYTALISDFVGRVDPATSSVVSLLKVSGMPTAVAVGFGSAWVADPADHVVLRLQPA